MSWFSLSTTSSPMVEVCTLLIGSVAVVRLVRSVLALLGLGR